MIQAIVPCSDNILDLVSQYRSHEERSKQDKGRCSAGGEARPVDSDADEIRPEGERLERILVVEDDAELRACVFELLRDLNNRVVAASSPQAALTILLQEEPKVDLLLTDVMPGINGR